MQNHSKATSDVVRRIFEGQWLHALLLVVLFAGCVGASRMTAVQKGQIWNVSSLNWYWIAIGVAVLHQVYVWFCWRMQLHLRSLTNLLGDAAFRMYAIGFAAFGIMRVVVVFLLAVANEDTVSANIYVLRVFAVVVAIPAVYTFYSVHRYFSFTRAVGADHFFPEYRTMHFERRGIFRFTSNGMYIYGFLLLWLPGLWFASAAALVAALFNHLYIWVHYFCTELPDIRRIYGDQTEAE